MVAYMADPASGEVNELEAMMETGGMKDLGEDDLKICDRAIQPVKNIQVKPMAELANKRRILGCRDLFY